MQAAVGAAGLLALFLCLSRAQAYTHDVPPSIAPALAPASYSQGGQTDSCTAVASIYNVGTGDSSDPEIYFDAEDAYGTTGVLSLQLDVLHEGFVNYTASIHNRYYNSLAWTTTFGATVIGYLDQSFANGTGTFSVHTNYNDEGIDNPPPTQGISFFNLGFSSDAPKTLHTFNTTVLSNAFLPEWVTFNGANCSVVLG